MTTPFREIRLPECVKVGMVGGATWDTTIIELGSGYEQRSPRWTQARREYQIEYVRTLEELKSLNAFHHVVYGTAYGFRLKDWLDFEVALAEGLLGAGVGDGTPTYQSKKRYQFDAETHDRIIKKLVAGTHRQYRNGSPITVGVSAGNIAVDANTGIVTFVADASTGIASHTPGSTHVFTTASNIATLSVGKKVYITGVSGTGAGVLNGVAHTINSKTGSGPYTWTLATNTSGLTASGGTIFAYPQAADALTWLGEFDVPVRFTSDKFQARVLSLKRHAYAIDNLGLKEIRV